MVDSVPTCGPYSHRSRVMFRMLVLLVVLAGGIHGQEPTPVDIGEHVPLSPAAARVKQESLDGLRSGFPGLTPDDMLAFYRENSPDILAEFHTRCEQGREQAQTYVQRMASHFRSIDQLREQNPDDYERALRMERLESRARELGRRIRALTGRDPAARDAGGPEAAATTIAVDEAKQELQQVLEESFRMSQQNQLIEINRLEAELRALRTLLEQREVSRRVILEQRFFQLSGQELPAEPKRMASEAAP